MKTRLILIYATIMLVACNSSDNTETTAGKEDINVIIREADSASKANRHSERNKDTIMGPKKKRSINNKSPFLL